MCEISRLGKRPEYPEGEERQSVPVEMWPGDYVLLTKEDWEILSSQVDSLKQKVGLAKLGTEVLITEFTIPDTGPRICPHCGMDHWMHRSRCRMLYADPNDPDAEY